MLRFTTIVALLALFIQYVKGIERVIIVTESDVLDDLIRGDEGNNVRAKTKGSGSDPFRNSCCIYSNCSCPSLYNVLANYNLTSNVLINITTDVKLPTIISLINLSNISIIGHNNPTVNCNNSGGLHFISCNNCTIEGITWERCGARNASAHDENVYATLQLYNSSNIAIMNCSFQHSLGQAVVLSGVSEDVNINHCNFLSNMYKQHDGHGAAIHYSSNISNYLLNLIITNCSFFYNGRAKSVVYLGHSSCKLKEYLYLQNSYFYHNNGVPIYLTNQNLVFNGNIEFYNNTAENGGAIFISNYSNIMFDKSATVNFTKNRANNNGGAIFLSNHSSILFNENPTLYQYHDNQPHNILVNQCFEKPLMMVTFYHNRANNLGQDIYAHNSNVTFDNNAMVTFSDNEYDSETNSSTVYTEHYSIITFSGNSTVAFLYNNACYNGGAMYIGNYCTVTYEGNSIVKFYNNLGDNGGAVYADHSTITFEGNSLVTFNNNRASYNGGAVFIDNCNVTLEGNSTLAFNNNTALDNNGGAL